MNYSALLPFMLLVPVAGAIGISFFGSNERCKTAKTALGVSTLAFVISLLMLFHIMPNGISATAELEYKLNFLPMIGSSFHLGVDGISLWLILLTNFLTPIAILGSFSGISNKPKTYYSLMLLLQAGMTGVFLSMDLLFFYMFFEFTLVPMFLLVGIWGGPNRSKAAYKLFIYTMAGGVLTFGGLLFVVWKYYTQTDIITFDIISLYATSLTPEEQFWIFVALFAGFAVKVPVFPFHTWLPLAHTEAPTAGSVILAGVLLKLGTYGFMKLMLPMIPQACAEMAHFVAILALIGIIYTALAAWVQTDVKKLVAYSSVSHLGFCMLGLFAFNHEGLSGSLLYMVNHGLSTGALFLVIGMFYERYHTREFSKIGGLSKKMPIMAFFMLYFSFSSIGLPGLNGFVSEFVILYSTFTSTGLAGVEGSALGPTFAIIAATGVILSAIYMLWMCQRVLFGPLKEPEVHHNEDEEQLPTDLNKREWGLLVPLAALVLILGVYPKIYFKSTDPAIDHLLQNKIVAKIEQDNNSQTPVVAIHTEK